MDIETYMREAARFDNHTDAGMLDALAHGVQAEAGEVLECVLFGWSGDELLHEMGDVAWGLGQLARHTGFAAHRFTDLSWAADDTAVRHAARLAAFCSKLSGVMEKSHRTTHADLDVHQAIRACLHDAWQALICVASSYGYSMEQVMQANIDKLTARYAERGLPVKEAS